jgi:BMFP domain-containing protein YqiC
LLFTVLHQSGPDFPEEDFTRTVTALHQDIRGQAQEVGEELQQWLRQQSQQEADETARKLQRLGLLAESASLEAAQQALERDFRRFAGRVGSESLLGMQGSGEEVFSETMPQDAELAKRVADGREYMASLGFRPGQGPLHEAWLLFRGSIHYDVMEHVVRDRMGIYRGSHGAHIENVGRTSFGTYNLVYQLGESLIADLASDTQTQEVSFAFSKGPFHYSDFRRDVSALMEQIGEHSDLLHISFWQRKLGLGTGKEFVLRLRLPAGEDALRETIVAIADTGRVGKDTVVKRGKMLLGHRVL